MNPAVSFQTSVLMHLLIVIFVSLVSSFIFCFLSKNKTFQHAKSPTYFKMYFFLLSCGFAVSLYRDATQVLPLVAGNVFYVSSAFVLRQGILVRHNPEMPKIFKNFYYYATGFIFILVIQYGVFYVLHNSLVMRLINVLILMACIWYFTAYELYKSNKDSKMQRGNKLFCVFLIATPTVNLLYPLLLIDGYTYERFLQVLLPLNIIHTFIWSIVITAVMLLDLIDTNYERSIRDALTGLYNRRFYNKFLERNHEIIKKNDDHNSSCSMLSIDIDHFKKINDTYGHIAGDYVIRKVAHVIQEQVDKKLIHTLKTDEIAVSRLGGEEFGVVCYQMTQQQACYLAEEIRAHVQELDIFYEEHYIQVTVSIGYYVGCTKESIDLILNNADKALYSAKQNGRNCVVEFVAQCND